MSSQPLSTFSSSSLCLPLTKFSYATVSNEHIVPIPWIHLSSKNSLFALFETSPTRLENGQVEDRQKLKVLRDPEIMEEIDLYLLAKEAHRSMNTAPTSLLDAQVPQVTIIVKVPNIAIKYPMTNGQIRRFQMRFATNEHYYDAMKVLSRAEVPTVEAGSFPTSKPQPAQYQPSNIQPDDSASQIGGLNSGPQSYATKAPVASEINSGPHPPCISTLTSAPTAHTMPPPNFRSIDHSVGHLPAIQNATNQISGNHSNLSSTTGTTLVPTINTLSYRPDGTRGYIGMTAHSEMNNVVAGQVGTNRCENQQSSTTHLADQSAGLLLPPRRELPFSKPKSPTKGPPPHEGITTAAGVTDIMTNSAGDWAIDNPKMSDPEQDLAPSIPAGRAKRAATKTTTKTPAKKPRVATTRKKPAAKKPAKNDNPVPSVDELLQQPEFGRMTRSRSILAAQASNQSLNQQSKGPFRDAGSASTLEQAAPSRDRSKQDVSFPTRNPVVQELEIQETLGEADHTFPCTPADQIIQTHTPRPPTMADGPVSPSRRVHRQEEQALKNPARSLSIINHQSSPNKAPAGVHMSDGMENAGANDSPFANSEASLQAWATLPPEIRNPALRNFVCHSIMQPSFVDLCKALENIWETTLLEPRLRKRDA